MMQPLLEIKAFFFNAKTDYLPYYKNFSIELTDAMCAKDLLSFIKNQNENFSYPEENLFFKINDLIVDADQNIKEVVERVGTSLQIDSLNNYRSTNGLCINDKDFMQSYARLAPFATEDDLAYYKSLYALHYASETEKFNHDYIGDAILLLAYKMITEGSEHKNAILEAVSSGLMECEYENNLFDAQDHTATIDRLKLMVKAPKGISFMDKIAPRFSKKRNRVVPDAEAITLEGKQVAYYESGASSKTLSVKEQIVDAGGKIISFSRSNKLSGLSLLERSPQLAYKKAGTTLLDAVDSGVEVLVVGSEAVFTMFTEHKGSIEKSMGRDIALPLMLASNLISIKQTEEV